MSGLTSFSALQPHSQRKPNVKAQTLIFGLCLQVVPMALVAQGAAPPPTAVREKLSSSRKNIEQSITQLVAIDRTIQPFMTYPAEHNTKKLLTPVEERIRKLLLELREKQRALENIKTKLASSGTAPTGVDLAAMDQELDGITTIVNLKVAEVNAIRAEVRNILPENVNSDFIDSFAGLEAHCATEETSRRSEQTITVWTYRMATVVSIFFGAVTTAAASATILNQRADLTIFRLPADLPAWAPHISTINVLIVTSLLAGILASTFASIAVTLGFVDAARENASMIARISEARLRASWAKRNPRVLEDPEAEYRTIAIACSAQNTVFSGTSVSAVPAEARRMGGNN